MASAEKGKYVVLFNSGNFIFFKHKNDKGIFCPKSVINSTRQVLKDDIYELVCESVTPKTHKDHPDMPEAAVLIATKAKFVKTPRVIQGVGTMKKISQDGEYGFIEYQDSVIKTPITAFCTRITVRPAIDKGGMTKFFAVGCKVRFVAKEQPPSGMFNIEWRVVTATDMKHEISETNFEKVTPVSTAPLAARPATAATVAPAAVQPVRPSSVGLSSALQPPPGLEQRPAAAASNGNGVSASSSSSSVANGVSYAARASSQLPEKIVQALQMANSGKTAQPILVDETLPSRCQNPAIYSLSDQEKEDLFSNRSAFELKENQSTQTIENSIYGCWPQYKKEEDSGLQAFEGELQMLRTLSTALHGGDSRACPISFVPRVS